MVFSLTISFSLLLMYLSLAFPLLVTIILFNLVLYLPCMCLDVHRYTCDEPNCGQTFARFLELRKHRKEKHPVVHLCDVCGQTFGRRSHLTSHIKTQHENTVTPKDFTFVCEAKGCAAVFTTEKHLKQHVNRIHNPNRQRIPCPHPGLF